MSATPSRLVNHEVGIPGTTVTAHLGRRPELAPEHWMYSLWTGFGDEEECIAVGYIDEPGLKDATPDQVARIAFLLEVEYPQDPDVRNWVPGGSEGDVEAERVIAFDDHPRVWPNYIDNP